MFQLELRYSRRDRFHANLMNGSGLFCVDAPSRFFCSFLFDSEHLSAHVNSFVRFARVSSSPSSQELVDELSAQPELVVLVCLANVTSLLVSLDVEVTLFPVKEMCLITHSSVSSS